MANHGYVCMALCFIIPAWSPGFSALLLATTLFASITVRPWGLCHRGCLVKNSENPSLNWAPSSLISVWLVEKNEGVQFQMDQETLRSLKAPPLIHISWTQVSNGVCSLWQGLWDTSLRPCQLLGDAVGILEMPLVSLNLMSFQTFFSLSNPMLNTDPRLRAQPCGSESGRPWLTRLLSGTCGCAAGSLSHHVSSTLPGFGCGLPLKNCTNCKAGMVCLFKPWTPPNCQVRYGRYGLFYSLVWQFSLELHRNHRN